MSSFTFPQIHILADGPEPHSRFLHLSIFKNQSTLYKLPCQVPSPYLSFLLSLFSAAVLIWAFFKAMSLHNLEDRRLWSLNFPEAMYKCHRLPFRRKIVRCIVKVFYGIFMWIELQEQRAVNKSIMQSYFFLLYWNLCPKQSLPTSSCFSPATFFFIF